MMTRRKDYPTEQKTIRSAAMLQAGISLFMTFFIVLWSWNNPADFIIYIGIDPSALKIPGPGSWQQLRPSATLPARPA